MMTSRHLGLTDSRKEQAAGLQMAALSLRDRPDPADFVNRFAGDDRYVVDFLLSEVLDRQPIHVQAFLEQTAILDRFSADLCNAVTERQDGRETIAYLDEANLFVVALDDQRVWYRYHHLFGNLLRYRLKNELGPAEICALHGRAAAWHARSERADEAIQHGLLAQEYDLVADFIELCVADYMRQGHVGRLLRWFDALPDHVILVRPLLCIYHGWIYVLTGQAAAAQRRMLDAEAALNALAQPSPLLVNTIHAHVKTMQAYFARRQYQMDEAILLLQQALAALPPADRLITCVVNYNLGFTYLLMGKVGEAIPTLELARNQALALDNLYTSMAAATSLAQAFAMQGHLRRAQVLYDQVIADGITRNKGQPHPLAGSAYAYLGELLYEYDDLARSEENLNLAIELGQLRDEASMCFDGTVELARLKQHQGDRRSADDLWRQAFSLAEGMGDDTRLAYAQAHRVRAWLTNAGMPERTQIGRWAETLRTRSVDFHNYQECYPQLVLAQVDLSQRNAADASTRLTKLEANAQQENWHGILIRVRALKAVAHAEQGAMERAMATLGLAFEEAALEGYLRTFLDLGKPMEELLRLAEAAKIAQVYVQRLLAAFKKEGHSADSSEQSPDIPLSTPSEQTLIEPLKAREQEILLLMAADLTHQQIADELHLSLNTIKWHARNLYGKLGVSRRAAAIRRARELGVL